ncbi:MAG: hypothetical protein ACRDHD_01515 [Candidatus Limnocylindria bacterium]
MLEFSAGIFFSCGKLLEAVVQECLLSALPVTGDEPIFHMFKDLDAAARDRADKSLKIVQEEFGKIGLTLTVDTIGDVIHELERDDRRCNVQWLLDQVRAIERLARRELRGKAFFYVPAERAKFFPRRNQPHIFGDAVAAAFPSATYDISESGICLALARGSAAVFHLMRVLEIGLSALGNKFGVSLAHTNWGPAIEAIEAKVRKLHIDPAWTSLLDYKEQQEFYSQAASHFGVLKDAWRNYTMHARGFYTEEQAEAVFDSVRGFMQKLAERLHE